jgi:hypothetical protein
MWLGREVLMKGTIENCEESEVSEQRREHPRDMIEFKHGLSFVSVASHSHAGGNEWAIDHVYCFKILSVSMCKAEAVPLEIRPALA